MKDYVIELKNLTKKYKIYQSNAHKFWDLISIRDKANYHTALDHLSFKIDKGEIIGIMGVNGSGKSTLLKILTGVTMPTDGTFTIHGRIASLLELNVGFDENLTGIENVYLKSYLLGLNRHEVDVILPNIIDFADIGYFIHQPVRTFSSGMKSRLGFAISIFVNPDIFIIDEALAVGDEGFKIKCYHAINEIKERGTTILLVSHSISTLNAFCDKGIWIHNGKLMDSGEINQVTFNYSQFLKSLETNKRLNEAVDQPIRYLTDIFERKGSSIRNRQNLLTNKFELNDEIKINFTYNIKRDLEFVRLKFYINDELGNIIFENNFSKDEYKLNGKIGMYNGRVRLKNSNLLPGKYKITIQLYDDTGFNKIYIMKDNEIFVDFNSILDVGSGLVYLEHDIYFEKWKEPVKGGTNNGKE